METTQESFLRGRILETFLRYVRIDTTSDRHSSDTPTTACQWNLIRLLEGELRDLGLAEVNTDEHGFLMARLPSNLPVEVPCIGFMAHVDTASDVPGENVRPIVHENYDGGPIELAGGLSIAPTEHPQLERYRGGTVITSDGTTLLGADDKAGIAEIMAALAWLVAHPEIPHGPLEVIFTPDEETGKGMDRFPRAALRSQVCYTLDGGEEGTVEAECFNAFRAAVECRGRVIHLGQARGRLVNAASMAAAFVGMLPRSESPEASDERFGYYCPIEMRAGLDKAAIEIFIRDFELRGIERRISALKDYARAVEAAFPGGEVSVKEAKQYLNMRESFAGRPEILGRLDEAIRMTGMEPRRRIIRGGTDGARLCELGIPTPNIFTGGHAFHSLQEWVALAAMVRAARVVVNLAGLWAGSAPVILPDTGAECAC